MQQPEGTVDVSTERAVQETAEPPPSGVRLAVGREWSPVAAVAGHFPDLRQRLLPQPSAHVIPRDRKPKAPSAPRPPHPSRARPITLHGVTKTRAEWVADAQARGLDITLSALRQRLASGWSEEKALSVPCRRKNAES